jgi:hypothetical protein
LTRPKTQERELYEELAFLFHHKIIEPKDYPALEKLAVELDENLETFSRGHVAIDADGITHN